MLQQPSGRFSLISRTRRYSANGGAVARVRGLCLWTNRRVAFRLSARREARTWVKRQHGRTLSSTSTSTLTWTSLTSCRVVRVKSRPTPRHTWPQFSHPHPTLPPPPSCVPPPTAHPTPRAAAADCHSPTDCGPQAEELDAAQLSLVCPVVRRDEPWSRRSERRAVNIYWGLLPPPFHRP